MALENYNIEESDIFIALCSEKNLSKNSIKKYRNCLKNYTNYHQLTLEELVDEAEKEEDNGVRLARRSVRTRLLNFRTHLINDLKYKASTIKTNMICAKALYRFYGIEIPEIPNAVLTQSPNDSIEFEDLPTINDIKTAIESTKKAKHKALFIFAACNGSARMELVNFTFKQFLDGVKPFCNNPETPSDIINDLDGRCDELKVIPVFRMKRQKTNRMYYTPITPEATQFCINYLKAEGMGLTLDDHFFQLSPDGVSTAFKLINEKFQWGKRGLYGFFSSHRIRKFNASVIEDVDFANFIQGRKPNPIKETYFKKDINRVREEYEKHMYKFTIYAHYDVMINSEAYNELQNQFKEEKRKHKEETEKLRKDYEEKINNLENLNKALSGQVTSIENRLNNIARENDITKIQETCFDQGLVLEYNLMGTVMKIYKEDIEKNPDLYVDLDYIDSIICLAFIRSQNDVLKEINENMDMFDGRYKFSSYCNVIANNYIESLGLFKSDDIERKLHKLFWDCSLGYLDHYEISIKEEEVTKVVDSIISDLY